MVTETAVLDAMFGKPGDGFHSGAVGREKSARVKYWRKPETGATDSGWIQLGPDLHTDIGKYETFLQVKGYKELPDSFGKEIAGMPESVIRPQRRYEQGEEHRWLKTFMDNGGLTYIIQPGDSFGTPGTPLMPASQIVSYNLHREPGMKDLRPDLADAVDIECPYACQAKNGRGRRMFSGLTRQEAEQSRDQHVLAVHKDTIASRAIGDEIAKTLSANAGIDATTIASIIAAVMAATGHSASPVAPVVVEVPVDEGEVYIHEPEPTRPPNAINIDTARRPDMMAFAKMMGFKTLPLSAKTDDWRTYLKEQLAS